jgi:E3 ubiquitin-protein ligase FANCL
MLDDIDTNTWVLEPDKPKRSDMSRRIALGNHCSLFIKLDELNPKKICDYTLFGAERFIAPLKINIAKNFNNWDPSLSIRQNLERILEINFPSPEESSDFNVACGICYGYRLDDVIPDQTCSNAKCGQPFHHVCLYEVSILIFYVKLICTNILYNFLFIKVATRYSLNNTNL